MVFTEWIFTEDDTDIKVSRREKSVTVHFITDQGTLILSLTQSQATKLKESLEERRVNKSWSA